MYTKTLMTTILLMILSIKFGRSLQCYEHGLCYGNNCDNVAMRNVTCKSSETKCWKLQVPGGVQRGCGEGNCHVEMDINVFKVANKCCQTDYCNTSNQMRLSAMTIVITGFIGILRTIV